MIRVQREDFDPGQEIADLTGGNHAIGGLVVFVGLVRDMAPEGGLSAMTLEHYPGMTEKMLTRIDEEAQDPFEALARYYLSERPSCPRLIDTQEKRTRFTVDINSLTPSSA